MRKTDIDHLLEAAVAKALGVKLPPRAGRKTARTRKSAQQSMRRAA